MNETRAQYGLRPLLPDAALSRAARLHAQRILKAGGLLEHQYPGELDLISRASQQGAHFSGLGENIAQRARTAAELHASWMSTPVHRANILSPRWTSVGIGVVESGGLLYAVEDFSEDGMRTSVAQLEREVLNTLQRYGIRQAWATPRAREACQSGRDPENSSLVITWDGPDPQNLPPVVQQRLEGAGFQVAEVGVCSGAPEDVRFTTRRVALLLR